MITQAIKTWLHKMFAWWPWKRSSQITYIHAVSPLKKGTSQESASRSTIDGVSPQAGITPRLSTIEEWPDRVVQPLFPAASEHTDPPLLASPAIPTQPPAPALEKKARDEESLTDTGEASRLTPPTPEQQLEFLQFLVKRGIVNEGFEEGKVPEQYKKP